MELSLDYDTTSKIQYNYYLQPHNRTAHGFRSWRPPYAWHSRYASEVHLQDTIIVQFSETDLHSYYTSLWVTRATQFDVRSVIIV